MTAAVHRPTLGTDPEHNQQVLQGVLDGPRAATLELPAGTYPVSRGLTVRAGWLLRGQPGGGDGRPGSWLESTTPDGQPVVQVDGCGVSVSDLGLRPPPSSPGEHGGDRGTAITVGRYLYPAEPDWIDDVDIRRVVVERPGDRAANCVALMGAVRGVTLHDVTVLGGHTGVAVHWGAVGADVGSITGGSYHPHRLRISDLRVRDAVEGFYLSSVYDTRVRDACLSNVEMGFRLLPGDNTDRFLRDPAAVIGAGIEVRGACVRWTGHRYGARIAGWGRSEVDGAVTLLRYTDTVVQHCVLRRAVDATGSAPGAPSWAPLLMESADGVRLHDIRVDSDDPDPCCRLAAA